MKLVPLLLLPALALAVPGPLPPQVPAAPAALGPVPPHAHPATSLREAVRRMRLSVGRELLLLARAEAGDSLPATLTRQGNDSGAEEQPDSPDPSEAFNTDDGFTEEPNDGTTTFQPLLPGTSVPPANLFTEEPSPSLAPTPVPGPAGSGGGSGSASENGETTDGPSGSAGGDGETTDGPIVDGPDPIVTPGDEGGMGGGIETDTDEPIVSPDDGTETVVVPRPVPSSGVVPSPDGEIISPEPVVTPPPGQVPPVDVTGPEPTPGVPQPSDDGFLEGTDLSESVSPEPVDDTFNDAIGSDLSPSEPAETGEVSEDPSPSPEDDDDSVCFPADATVELENGATKTMSQVRLGDRLRVGPNEFSDVFMFTHKTARVAYNFVTIRTESGHSLKLTKGHYLYLNGMVAAAKTAKLGDFISLADGSISSITGVEEQVDRGLYNPQTVHGDIIVNGVRATTYTTTVERGMAHALLAPLRAVYSSIGWSLSAFDSGADRLASILPSGSISA